MTQSIRAVRADVSQIPRLLAIVRPEDRSEWVASSGTPLAQSLASLTSWGGIARTALTPDGEPLAMWGVVPSPLSEEAGVGYVWLIATTLAHDKVFALHRVINSELGRLHVACPKLVAIADCRNPVHHRWLDWLGFAFEGIVPFGPWGLPFKKYTRMVTCADQQPA